MIKMNPTRPYHMKHKINNGKTRCGLTISNITNDNPIFDYGSPLSTCVRCNRLVLRDKGLL